MSPFSTIVTAVSGVVANGLRTTLTMLGIIIGVASVIATLALGNGARAAVEANFRFLGSDEVRIAAAQKLDRGEITPVGKILSYEDGLRMAEAVPLVRWVEMEVAGEVKLRYQRAVLDTTAIGRTAEAPIAADGRAELQPVGWPSGTPLTNEAFLAQGRFFAPAEVLEGAEVCVLGYQTALDLFEGDDLIGESIWVNRQRCLVIGVLTELETVDPAERNRTQPNELLLMPVSTAIRNLYDEEPSVTITAHIADESQVNEAKAQIATYLRQRHGIERNAEGEYEDDFVLTTRDDVLGAQQEAARTFSYLLAGMAAVSLVVGGIGIMNVMLVSVTERTREIGIRMAVGAGRPDIVAQFLLEAVLISAGGGILGIALGVLAVPLAGTLNQGMALLAPTSIPLAFGVALLTGVVFGLYPALRASLLDPIEALRYE